MRFPPHKIAGICMVLSFAGACGPRSEPVDLASEVTDFKTLFDENCIGCHGVDGKHGPAPVLNSSVYLALVPQESLRQTIEQGRPGTPMPAFAQSQGGPLSDAQVNALVTGIRQKWAQAEDLNGVTLPPYNAPSGVADHARGKEVFAMACASCHGNQGRAGSITDRSFLSLISDQGLRTSTIVSRPDLGAPDWRGYIPGRALNNQEIDEVVAYLVSLRSNAATSGGE